MMIKKSELTFTGDTYYITPDGWGESYIATDIDAVRDTLNEHQAEDEQFEYPDHELQEIEIVTDKNGNYYAYYGDGTDRLYPCENPDDATENLFRWLAGDSVYIDDTERDELEDIANTTGNIVTVNSNGDAYIWPAWIENREIVKIETAIDTRQQIWIRGCGSGGASKLKKTYPTVAGEKIIPQE